MQNAPRVISVDALRGFDMLCILGIDRLCIALQNTHTSRIFDILGTQMTHVEWSGLHFYDLIFPLFLFLVGVALTLSRPSTPKVIRRSIILFLLGIFYMGGIAKGFHNVYLAGVLQRIAEAYLFTGLIFCWLRDRVRLMAVLCAATLIGYWALLTFVPVPGYGQPSYERGKNLAHYVDVRYLPGRSVREPSNFEGSLLNTMGAVGNCLLGVFAGLLLQRRDLSGRTKATTLAAGGAFGILAGLLWSLQFPIVKLLWTSSYVLVTCGISAVLLAALYFVIDIRGHRTWAQPFVWVGMNSITLYLIANIVNFPRVAARIIGPAGDIAVALLSLALIVTLAWFLQRRKIFLRV